MDELSFSTHWFHVASCHETPVLSLDTAEHRVMSEGLLRVMQPQIHTGTRLRGVRRQVFASDCGVVGLDRERSVEMVNSCCSFSTNLYQTHPFFFHPSIIHPPPPTQQQSRPDRKRVAGPNLLRLFCLLRRISSLFRQEERRRRGRATVLRVRRLPDPLREVGLLRKTVARRDVW